MKLFPFIALLMLITTYQVNAQTPMNPKQTLGKEKTWTDRELMEPSELAALIKSNKPPVIFNIGVVDNIKGARNVGNASDPSNLQALGLALKPLDKKSMVVIYCGCCPFERCPNIRPALSRVKSAGFSNVRLLNLPVNLKENWISQGYPLESN